MTELLTSAQMRSIEDAEMSSGAVTGLDLMERAGQGVVDAIFAQWPKFATGRHLALVLCGPGNNGGDGFVIARLLDAAGWTVRVHFSGDTQGRSGDARVNHGKWSAHHPVAPLTLATVMAGPRPDLIVDAVFGTGITRPLSDDLSAVLDAGMKKVWSKPHEIRKVAVDAPSGLNLDTGFVPSDRNLPDDDAGALPQYLNAADLTVAFHAAKLGHYLGMGPALCGTLKVVDIGLGRPGDERAIIGTAPDAERVRLVEPQFMGRPLPSRIWPGQCIGRSQYNSHKYDHGHAIVFAGGVGKGGAARLAARAALRIGAGLVTVVCPPSALIENACHLDAIMLSALGKDENLDAVADDRASAFVVGPGLGVGQHTRRRVLDVLDRREQRNDQRAPAVVLDADALTSFSDDPSVLFGKVHSRTILTPHEGEFGRLFPDLSQSSRIGKSKVDAVREAADRAGCVILLKGSDTVIAQPGGGASVHSTAYGRKAPWLATAGAGDVLAGMIGGMAAPATSPDIFEVAEAAVYLHVETARAFGPGLIAEDLPETLPQVFRNLGL
ncbi:YjeF family protein [Sulfitobacter noctilucicola]|uniref:Bifunctional NAD(P)H-hydrate repair enzyme n=1 Tax=Sulfitobacter noctilucicola TaxID=1342301 RepID=A0A7W6MB31_9RHOB|nr:bifunctional ADP-dependent NAD(P)H-hydrate dehydratase/NAD(P)H-hydrate epimerase [Sulfitobacter noctilucicola]KIN64158.1 YjeF family protein [Sulfitobacter noctilucicola]MBB4175512.1 hydroxyethylthiazole kinase-like uncharacterized protein yjeF [Sulfitobacter noctilucicola]